jgi:HD-GYP domain-containing protein (c-di-GMP phosphodiesterase class II)
VTTQDLEGRSRRASERTAEQAKSFLSALFMGIRTARIHSTSNRAFENAVRTLYDATRALYAATNGFRLVFVGDTTLLNDQRLRIDSTTFAVTRTLRGILEAKKMGGLGVEHPPTFESSQALIELMSAEGEADADSSRRAQILPIAPQAFVDDQRGEVRIDPKERATRVYAKLLIALRDHFERYQAGGPSTADLRRMRIVRVIQDLVEVSSTAPSVVLLLANHRADDWPTERHGANTCVLSIAMGLALGLDRSSIMDLGVAAALHHLGVARPFDETPGLLDVAAIHRGIARLLAEASTSASTARRAMVIGSHRRPAAIDDPSRVPPLLARIVGLAATYDQLCSGYGLKRKVQGAPVDVLALLSRDQTGRFDPQLVDLLINILRVFPVGVHVVLQSGGRGIVSSHGGSRRWDRPVVAQIEPNRTNLDLMVREHGHFRDAIVGTIRFLGAPALPGDVVPADPAYARRDAEPVTTDLEQLEHGERLRQMPPDAEDLFKSFLNED